MHYNASVFLFLLCLSCTCLTVIHSLSTTNNTILLIPLDERFTTRAIVLNLARLIQDEFTVLTPSIELISDWKRPANTSILFDWLENQIISSCSLTKSCSLLISTEQFLYGGLITSRVSNTSLDELTSRLKRLVELKRTFGDVLQIYLSAVIMRIPAYNGDFEEPDYWANYGRLIYLWSFYTDRYAVLGNPADEEQIHLLQQEIPADILEQFVWRRERNHNLTVQLLHDYASTYFDRIWLTLDDNAEYGLNKAEERQLIQLINDPSINISSKVNLYPGADEVSLAMLSQIVVNNKQPLTVPTFTVRYRNVTTKHFIPNYEGAPLNETVLKQIQAVGGHVINQTEDTSADIIVLVNNWSTDTQEEASIEQSCADYSSLDIPTTTSILVYADVRYSNGGDICFAQWIRNRTELGSYAYAGWNTNGNTLGTCLSNGVLLKYYLNLPLIHTKLTSNATVWKENRQFTSYRLIEDVHYQAYLRQLLLSYLSNVSHDPSDRLSNDLNFYETFVAKGFNAYAFDIGNEFQVTNVYYPWNRTFEIGFELLEK
jgi:hypothetical protein